MPVLSPSSRLPGLGVELWGENGQTVLVKQADWQTSLWRWVGWHELEASLVSRHTRHALRLVSAPFAHNPMPSHQPKAD